MFTNIAIISPQGCDNHQIRNFFRNPVKFRVREFRTMDEINAGLATFPFDVLIMWYPSFEMHHAQNLYRLRARFPRPTLLTISPQIDPAARYSLRDLPNHKLIHEASESEDLLALVEKMNRGESSYPRLHPRVKRADDAEVVDPKTGVRIKGHFQDFAQMGARLVVQARTPLKAKSRVQLTYKSSSEPGKVHRIEAMIMWAEITSGMVGTIMNGPQQVLGIRFIAAL